MMQLGGGDWEEAGDGVVKSLELAAGQRGPGPGGGSSEAGREDLGARGFGCPSRASRLMVREPRALEAWVGLVPTPALSPCSAIDPGLPLSPWSFLRLCFCFCFF